MLQEKERVDVFEGRLVRSAEANEKSNLTITSGGSYKPSIHGIRKRPRPRG